VEVVVKAIHVLAACVWVGGTVVLVFIAVPYARTLNGEARASMLRALGRGWRPLGWGALALLVATGVELAVADDAFGGAGSDFDAVLVATGVELAVTDDAFGGAGSDFDAVLVAKVSLVALLALGAFLHDFVLGPRLARQIREGREQSVRRPLVVVGWTNFVLTLTVPVLGVVLVHLG